MHVAIHRSLWRWSLFSQTPVALSFATIWEHGKDDENHSFRRQNKKEKGKEEEDAKEKEKEEEKEKEKERTSERAKESNPELCTGS